MKLLLIVLFATISSQTSAKSSLDIIQKNCHFKALKESFKNAYYVGINSYSCQNNTEVKITYSDKAIRAVITHDDKMIVVSNPDELSLVTQQINIFYKESDEFKFKKDYQYFLPVTFDNYNQWRYQ